MSVRANIDRGLEIVAKIAELEAELDRIEQALTKEGLAAGARGEHADLKDAARDGRLWLARGSAMAVPMIFTADKIIGSFTAGSARHTAIKDASGGKFSSFFRPSNKFESLFDDGKQFRAAAAEIIGPKAPAFITACVARDKSGIPKSDIKILWSAAEDTH